MSFDFSTLITDRAQTDISRANDILARANAGTATQDELEELYSGSLKGAYDYTDLNRVTDALEYLNQELERYGYSTGYTPMEIDHRGGSRLPDGYTELEYIESNGKQYIDTGFKPNQDTRVIMDFELLKMSNQYAEPIFGVRTSASSNGYYLWASGTSTAEEQYQSGYGGGSTYVAVTRVGRHTVDKNKNVTTIDGKTSETSYSAFTTSWNMLVLESYNNGSLRNESVFARIYSMKIYDDDTLVRSYVPCKNSSGKAGLYDLVSDSFFASYGESDFIAGTEKPVSDLDRYTWYDSDIPTPTLLKKYLDNVKAIRDALKLLESTPDVPDSMELFTYLRANDIEKILVDVESVIRVMEQTFVPCGPATCGGDYL